MITKSRIALIRLSDKLAKDNGYAEKIGVKIELKKIGSQQDNCLMKGEQYEYSRCKYDNS